MSTGLNRRYEVLFLAFFLGCSSLASKNISAEQTPANSQASACSVLAEEAAWSGKSLLDDDTTAKSCACSCPGWYVQADYLNWQPRRTGLGVAILDPSGVGVPSDGNPVEALDLGQENGLRVGVGRRTVSGWDMGFRYTNWFNVSTTADFADNFNGGSLDDGLTGLGFDGFFLRLAYVR